MACIDTVTQCITQGNDWFLDVTLTDDGVLSDAGVPENPKDITGATVVLLLKETKEGATIIAPTVTIGDAVNGQVSFTLTAAQTETLIVEPSDTGKRMLYGSPRITYADGTIDDLFTLDVEIHQSWN